MYSAVLEFRRKLESGQRCLGAGITLTDSTVLEALAPALDFFWIDLEHTHLSYETVQNHLIAARATNLPALVRVRGSDAPHIKPLLDIGASGIIVPQVTSAAEVKKIVDLCRYAPLGKRGYGPRRPTLFGRAGGKAWMEEMNRQIFVAVQIENLQGLHEAEAIAAIEGLDSLALGPYDLSIALGHPGDINHPVVLQALRQIVETAKRSGKYIGTGLGAYAADALELADLGLQWLQCGDDSGYLANYADNLMKSIRESLKHEYIVDPNDPTSRH